LLASGLVAVWLGRESLTPDCALAPVWLGIELSDALDDGVPPLPGPRLPFALLGFDPFGILLSFDGDAIGGDAALFKPDVTPSAPLDGRGVLLMAGLPAAGSGVCAHASIGGNTRTAANTIVDKLKRDCPNLI
jgi:hypothetical protein